MKPIPDAFLSEEDLDLINLPDEELYAWWNLWLRQAQITNDLDQDDYSHGVFMRTTSPPPYSSDRTSKHPP
jgi:hypothetical protein